MPRLVQGPDGVTHSFPDDATDQEIAKALGTKTTPPPPTRPQVRSRTGQMYTPPAVDTSDVSEFAKGAASNYDPRNILALLKGLYDDPLRTAKNVALSPVHLAGELIGGNAPHALGTIVGALPLAMLGGGEGAAAGAGEAASGLSAVERAALVKKGYTPEVISRIEEAARRRSAEQAVGARAAAAKGKGAPPAENVAPTGTQTPAQAPVSASTTPRKPSAASTVPTGFKNNGGVAEQARAEAFDRVANRNGMAQNVVGNTPGSEPSPRVPMPDASAPVAPPAPGKAVLSAAELARAMRDRYGSVRAGDMLYGNNKAGNVIARTDRQASIKRLAPGESKTPTMVTEMRQAAADRLPADTPPDVRRLITSDERGFVTTQMALQMAQDVGLPLRYIGAAVAAKQMGAPGAVGGGAMLSIDAMRWLASHPDVASMLAQGNAAAGVATRSDNGQTRQRLYSLLSEHGLMP